MYTEGILFPRINLNTALDDNSIIGSIPDPVLTELMSKSGFASIKSHIRSRLSNPYSYISTDS